MLHFNKECGKIVTVNRPVPAEKIHEMKLRKSELKIILETCKRTSRVLESIEAPVLRWAVRKEKALGAYNNYLRKKKALADELPDSWHDMTAAQVAAGQVFVHPGRTRKFLRSFRDALSSEEKELLRHFIENPWFYGVLVLEETLDMDFFTMVDVETRDKLLLHSAAVREISRSGARLYLTLLLHNGDCYQTFGPLHYYRGFQPYDFEYFAKQLSPLFYKENGLSATIANNPAAFLLLDNWSETPAVSHRGDLVQICCEETSLGHFDPQRYSGSFDIDSTGQVVRCRLKGQDSPLRSAAAYYDGSKKKLFVRTTSLELYRKVHSALAEDIPLSEEPYWLATIYMNMAGSDLLGKDVPAAPYVDMFEVDQEPASPEDRKHLDTLNAVMREMTRRHNEGIPYSLEELAREHGVDLDTVRQVEKIFEQASSGLDLEIAGGLEGYRPPPPVVRQKFRRSPWDNGVFVFLDSPRVRAAFTALQPELEKRSSKQKAGSFDGPPDSLEEFPKWIEDLYSKTERENDFTLLNIALHLLCSRGEAMEAVRDYAVEVLRLYWQVFLPSKEPEHSEGFSGRFALFCYEILYRGGLAEIDPVVSRRTAERAEFRLRPSAFFRAWASLTRDERT